MRRRSWNEKEKVGMRRRTKLDETEKVWMKMF